MVRRWAMILALIVIAVVSLPALAQEKDQDAGKQPKSPTFYKLDLSVREMDGSKVVNSRSYTLNAKGDDYGRFRVGSKIPVNTGTTSSNSGNISSVTQWQYVDVGLNADCHIIESDPGPTLWWTIELSSVAPERGAGEQPVIRNVRSTGATLLSLNKPIVLSSSDDLSSTHKFVFEVTATRIK